MLSIGRSLDLFLSYVLLGGAHRKFLLNLRSDLGSCLSVSVLMLYLINAKVSNFVQIVQEYIPKEYFMKQT